MIVAHISRIYPVQPAAVVAAVLVSGGLLAWLMGFRLRPWPQLASPPSADTPETGPASPSEPNPLPTPLPAEPPNPARVSASLPLEDPWQQPVAMPPSPRQIQKPVPASPPLPPPRRQLPPGPEISPHPSPLAAAVPVTAPSSGMALSRVLEGPPPSSPERAVERAVPYTPLRALPSSSLPLSSPLPVQERLTPVPPLALSTAAPAHQRLVCHSPAPSGAMEQIDQVEALASCCTLEPGDYVLRLVRHPNRNRPSASSQVPWLLLWLHGGRFINPSLGLEVGLEVGQAWVVIGPGDDILLRVVATTTLWGLPTDTNTENGASPRAAELAILALGQGAHPGASLPWPATQPDRRATLATATR